MQTILNTAQSASRTTVSFVRFTVGYGISLMPMGLLVLFYTYFSVDITICSDLKSKFLLDNGANLANGLNFSDVYDARKRYHRGSFVLQPGEFNHMGRINDLMWRNESKSPGHIGHSPYWPLNNIADLINQYNFVGYHDICIYPE